MKIRILYTVDTCCSLSHSDRTASVTLLPGEQGKSGTGAETSLAGAGQQTPVGWFLKALMGWLEELYKKITVQYVNKCKKEKAFAF